MKKYKYIIPIKDGKKITIYFYGNQFEKLLNEYKIPYEKEIESEVN